MAKKTVTTHKAPQEYTEFTTFLIVISLLLISVLLLGAGFFLGSSRDTHTTLTPTVFPQDTREPKPTSFEATTTASLPNPASAFCTQQGGTLSIETRSDGGQYGLCSFEDNRACEEWAMFRGECPVGGVKTTGFDTVEQRYCAWSGGATLASANATCTFSDGTICDAKAFYNGTCSK